MTLTNNSKCKVHFDFWTSCFFVFTGVLGWLNDFYLRSLFLDICRWMWDINSWMSTRRVGVESSLDVFLFERENGQILSFSFFFFLPEHFLSPCLEWNQGRTQKLVWSRINNSYFNNWRGGGQLGSGSIWICLSTHLNLWSWTSFRLLQ